jgi:hypothetical protein
MFRHLLDCTNDRALTHCIAVGVLELAERKRGQVGTPPKSENPWQ